MNYSPIAIRRQKSIALIAHDQKKRELIQWCGGCKGILSRHFLCGADATACMITDVTNLPVEGHNNGPLGGDQQIGAKIVEGKVDFVISFPDLLAVQSRDPDVKVLLRTTQVYDTPIVNNKVSVDSVITSPLMDKEYERNMVNFRQNIADRVNTLQKQDIQ